MEHYSAGDKTTMIQPESQWDKFLKIKTTGRDDSRSDRYRYPYEPTLYPVLERLADSGYIGKRHTLLDYGTGKGRVCFYLSYQTGCRSIGVECDERIYASAAANRLSQVDGSASPWKVRNSTGFRQRRTDAISSTRFPWKS